MRSRVAAAEIEPHVRRGLSLLHLDDRALEDVACADLHRTLRWLSDGLDGLPRSLLRLRARCVRPHQLADCAELAASRRARMRLDGAVEADQLLAGRRDDGAAATQSAGLGRDRRLTQRMVDL